MANLAGPSALSFGRFICLPVPFPFDFRAVLPGISLPFHGCFTWPFFFFPFLVYEVLPSSPPSF
jgi:hypothetical protein